MRLACVAVPFLPLQLLLRRHPDWAPHPVAVIDEDRPQGKVEWVNEPAWRVGVLPGLRYAAALSLAKELRAGTVSPDEVQKAVTEALPALRKLTPFIEASTEEPGVFWLDASGLGGLYPSMQDWGQRVQAAMGELELQATVTVGYTRFGTYAVARERHGIHVLQTPTEERAASGRVLLSRLQINPKLRERLERLGVHTVADFLALPAGGLLRRFGAEALRLHRLAQDELFAPLRPTDEPPENAHAFDFDWPERNVHPLLFIAKRLLDPLLSDFSERHVAVALLVLELRLEHEAPQLHRFRPATPTLDSRLLLELVRLRLESLALPAGVVSLHLAAEEAPAHPEQLRLFALSQRDHQAAERALARVRAEFGDTCVGIFEVREGHLPEARFLFVPRERFSLEAVPGPRRPLLIRRMHPRPLCLPPKGRQISLEDGWQPRSSEMGPIIKTVGPYRVSGGWWRSEERREYAFAETKRGDLLWIFERGGRWYEQGRVE